MRLLARVEYFHGEPCRYCKGTLRYVSWKRCVACERARYDGGKPLKRNERLMWLKPVLIDGVRVPFAPLQRDVFAILFNARGGYVPTGKIVDFVWQHSDDPPLEPNHVLQVYINRIRKMLSPTRFRILNDWGRGYRLVRIEQSEKMVA